MRKLCVLVSLLLFLTVSAQSSSPATQTVVSTSTPKQFATLTAQTTFYGTGLGLAYGQQDFFAPGTDARFGIRYATYPYSYYGASLFGLELNATALAYTYDPQPDTGLALIAYGGLGPRLQMQTGVTAPYPEEPGLSTTNAYVLAVSGVGGFETRIQNFGIFLELELGLPVFTLYGSQFQIFSFAAGAPLALSLGGNYYF